MIIERHYINGTEVNPPKNWQELAIELNYGKDQFPQSGVISITDFDWVRENYDLIIKHIDGGLTGDVGIFEGLPYRIDISKGTATRTVFSGFINLAEGLIIKDKIRINAKATNKATVDWLYDRAGFSFEYLASLPSGSKGYISTDLYKFVPYVNSKVPNYEQAAITALMSFAVIKAIEESATKCYDLLSEIVMNWSDIEITEVLKLIIELAYLATLVAAIIKLVEDVVKFIISPIKYHAGMYVRDLMAVGVEFVSDGKMTFGSDIWEVNSPYYNEIIIPEKLYNAPSKSDSSILGFLVPEKNEQFGYFKGNFAQLLDAMKIKYNAKLVVTSDINGGGTIQLMRKDKNALPPSYQLPDIYQPEYSYNTDELISNYEILYQTDGSDTNTLQDYAGTAFQVITQPIVVNNRQNVMIKNLQIMQIPFARASRKEKLTEPEKMLAKLVVTLEKDIAGLHKLLSPIDKILNVFKSLQFKSGVKIIDKAVNKFTQKFKAKMGATPVQLYVANIGGFGLTKLIGDKLIKMLTNLKNSIKTSDRIGMMLLSDDHFSVAKILILKEGSESKYNRVDASNATTESAKAMWDGFHYVNSFLPKQLTPLYADRPTGNQYMIKNFPKVPFTWNDYLKVAANNRIYDVDGNVAIIESLKFNPAIQSAEMRVRFGKVYTLNLIEAFLNPTGA